VRAQQPMTNLLLTIDGQTGHFRRAHCSRLFVIVGGSGGLLRNVKDSGLRFIFCAVAGRARNYRGIGRAPLAMAEAAKGLASLAACIDFVCCWGADFQSGASNWPRRCRSTRG
jgi:hypothetical protein